MKLRTPRTPSARRQKSRGVSIIEVMVGVAIGLVLVSGVLTLFVTNLTNARRMLVEARLNQDLRAATDLIVRDLRRGAYWQNSIRGTAVVGAAAAPDRNPYQAITPGGSNVYYTFSRNVENDIPDDDERFGFLRATQTVNGVARGIIQMQTANGVVQTVTDPNVIDVTAATLTDQSATVPAGNACPVVCAGAGCPTVQLRNYLLVITARATADDSIVRQMTTRVRVRNDFMDGSCPAS